MPAGRDLLAVEKVSHTPFLTEAPSAKGVGNSTWIIRHFREVERASFYQEVCS